MPRYLAKLMWVVLDSRALVSGAHIEDDDDDDSDASAEVGVAGERSDAEDPVRFNDVDE